MTHRLAPYRHHAADACRRTEDGTHVRAPVLPAEEHACLECLAPAPHPRELWAPDGAPAVVVWLCPEHAAELDTEASRVACECGEGSCMLEVDQNQLDRARKWVGEHYPSAADERQARFIEALHEIVTLDKAHEPH